MVTFRHYLNATQVIFDAMELVDRARRDVIVTYKTRPSRQRQLGSILSAGRGCESVVWGEASNRGYKTEGSACAVKTRKICRTWWGY